MIAGRYTLDREIGRGGMGAVHLARDEVLGRQVAIKRIGMLPGASMPDLARAEREARLAATLNHPHVVSIFDLVVEDGDQWLVMEYVDGESLAERIRNTGPLDHAAAASIMWQVSDALAAAHRAGIMHRDVKPSNIMVTEDGQAKLTDFGIARAQADASLTQTGLVTGSPAYLAPEVASGTGGGAASDVWALGATLFHALAGTPPYDVSDNLIGGLYKIVHDEPPRVPDAGRFEELLRATMTREPDARWSMGRVRDKLAEIKADPGAAGVTSTIRQSEPRTEVLPADTPAAVPPVPPARTSPGNEPAPVPVPAPAPAPVPAAAPAAVVDDGDWDDDRDRDRRPWWPWLAGLALAAVAAFALYLLTSGGDGDQPVADDPSSSATSEPSDDASQEPTDEPEEEPTEEPSDEATEEPTQEPTDEESPSPAASTRQELRTFVSDYLATVTSDPEAGYAMLTPGFQQSSGGFGSYSGYWGTIATATPRNIVADPASLTVSYDVDYVRQDGSTATGSVQLQLERAGDRYLIAAES